MSPEQIERASRLLNERESEALRRLGEAADRRLSPASAAQFFSLFLQGYGTEEIARQNPALGGQGLGLIVRARLEYDWDAEREKHTRDLMSATRLALEKATLDGIQFASDGMAVFHRMVGDRFRKYLQTGDSDHLGDLKDMSLRTYRAFVDLLKELSTPPEDPRRKAPSIAALAVVNGIATPGLPAAFSGPVTPETAAALLEALNHEKPVTLAKELQE